MPLLVESTHAVLDIRRLCDGRGHWLQRVRASRFKSTLVSCIKSRHCCRYQATFKYSAITVPIIMLTVLWVFGAALLVTQQRHLRAGLGLSLQGEPSVEMVEVGAGRRSGRNVGPDSSVAMRGRNEIVNPRRAAWAFYVCFVAG